MPRPLRPIDAGLIYHVINRGNNRQDVFHKPDDYAAFLRALGELKERCPFELYGYCLMTNHVHLLIRPRETSISRLIQSLLVSHTQRYHKHYHSGGHVWQGRFKSPVIEDDEHLLTVLRYIEANPLRAKLAKDAGKYPWSSYACHGLGVANDLLDPLAIYEGLAKTSAARQRRWHDKVHRPFEEHEAAAIQRSIATGLPYGSADWVAKLSAKLELPLTIRPRGRPRKPSDQDENK